MPVSRQSWRGRGRWASKEDPGLRHGYRSGLEEDNAKLLESWGVPVLFETTKVRYEIPASLHIYTPDFELPNGIIIETKGKFEPQDRNKHLLVQAQHPELDIRFVFQRPSDPINKGSKTTYAVWCERHGFKWAFKRIPLEWVREEGPKRRPAEVLKKETSS